ncbi:hypothetical protein Golax_019614 [Gossypium laxum]|uniref:Uncharacterized protein n=1 Tax=Gossypium laxum TaxID=34288 RepID=A0A7J8Z7K6_9ROSI|nr:hypothetical protein [Gossypium laxum]
MGTPMAFWSQVGKLKIKRTGGVRYIIFIDALGRLVRDVGDKNLNPNLVGKTGNNVADNIENCLNRLRFRVVEEILSALREVADLITSELEGHAVQEKAAKGKERPNCHVFKYNEYNPDIISLLEMRVSGFKADAIISKLGSKRSHQVEAVGFSGGIWLGLKEFVDVEIEKEASLKGFEVVYSPRALSLDGNGDFNAILSVEEKNMVMHQVIDVISLVNLWIWPNSMIWDLEALLLLGIVSYFLKGWVELFGNDAWLDFSPNCLVTNLPRIKSDHIPILLTLQL